MKKEQKLYITYVVIISTMILGSILIRAATTAITWDEAYTYVAYAKNFNINQLIDIRSNLANNHILNTILIAILDGICNLPYNEFIIRLPNILMCIFYLFGSYLVSKEQKYKYLMFAGLTLNYYVIEFFGLGRGYGIATAFIIYMCYFLKKATENEYKNEYILLSGVFGLLACYANTTSLIGLFSICIIYLVDLIKKKKLYGFIKKNIIGLIPMIVLLIYIIIFHFTVTGGDKPVFGETNIIGFLENNFIWMFLENKIANIVLSIIAFTIIVISIIVYRNKIWDKKCFISLTIIILTLILPSLILGKPFPTGRCLIPLWPIVVLGMLEIYSLWMEKINDRIANVLSILCTIVLITLFIYRIDLTKTRTWANNYVVRDVLYQALAEHRVLTDEEYEMNKGFFGITFYRNKILEKYNFDVLQKNK